MPNMVAFLFSLLVAVQYSQQGYWEEKSFGIMRDFYKVFREEATFDQAEQRCVAHGGHLVSIHSNAENDFVYGLATTGQQKDKYTDFPWIGLKQKYYPRDIAWSWIDNTPMNYFNWSTKQPDNGGPGEHCAQMFTDKANLYAAKERLWNDIHCETKLAQFVCKRSVVPKYGR
ncbi:lectin C-type domain protein [Cooperia oncophora]